jgi:AcrR family transcriptional regulator
MPRPKRRRRYDSTIRKEKAESSRARVLDSARDAFLRQGYPATTITEIAKVAAVSPETIYKAFGGKAGIVRALYERALEGRGATPAPARSDASSETAADGRALVAKWGELLAEVSPLVSPIMLLVRSAASSDPALAELVRDSDAERLERMRLNARRLSRRGFLRRDVSIARAADVMWMWTSEEIYDLFVVRRGWSPAALGAHVAEMLAAALLR